MGEVKNTPKVKWQGPIEVDTDQIDYSNESTWKASSDGKLDSFVEKIQKGVRKPIVLIKRPSKDKLMVADGHHRALAYRKLGMPAPAFVATVPTDDGPWNELHASQKDSSGEPKRSGPVEK